MIWDALFASLSELTVRQIALGLAIVSALLLAIEERRLSLLPLLGQYLLLGSLVAAAVFPYIMVVRVAVGLAICLMLYVSAHHVQVHLNTLASGSLRRALGLASDVGILFRLLTCVIGGLIAYGLWSNYPIPELSSEIGLACYWLITIGLLMALTSSDPLRMGYGVLTVLNGFSCFYIFLERSLVVIGLTGFVDIIAALAVVVSTEAWLVPEQPDKAAERPQKATP